MPPPNKRQRQLHRLLDVKKQNRETERIDFELADEEQVAIIDDDFDLDGLSQNQELLQSRWEDLIKWNPAAEHSLRSAYTGDSRATKYRRLKEEEKRRRSVADCARIETFFAKSSAPCNPPEVEVTKIEAAIAKLESLNLDANREKRRSASKEISQFDALRLLAILRYLRMLQKNTRSRIQSSELVAEVFFGKSGESYRARTIRDWAEYYLLHLDLPLLRQGKYQKTKSLIDDEDVRSCCLSFLRSTPSEKRTAATFERWINSELKKEAGIDYDLSVSRRTAQNWLLKLGFCFQEYRQGSAYVDGHERPDVVAHRNRFVDEMAEWQRRMETFVGDEMETCIQPELDSGKNKVVLVTQDECIFQAHDGARRIWQEKTRKELRPKGPGASMMVSAFLCQCHGLLRLPEELTELHPEIPTDSTVIMHPGANKDGYFTNEDLASQTRTMLIVFDVLHPGCTALVAYDNSSNHHAMANDAGKNADGWWIHELLLKQVEHFMNLFELAFPYDSACIIFDCSENHAEFAKDALVVNRMNVHPGGKQSRMRSSTCVHASQRHLPVDEQTIYTQ